MERGALRMIMGFWPRRWRQPAQSCSTLPRAAGGEAGRQRRGGMRWRCIRGRFDPNYGHIDNHLPGLPVWTGW